MQVKLRVASLYMSFLLITVGVISNVLCAKLLCIEIFGVSLTLSGSTPFFVIVFMLSNLLIELEGASYSKLVVTSNYVCVLISVIMLMTVNQLPGKELIYTNAFDLLFSTNYKFLVASVLAYVCSMSLQSKLFRHMRKSVRHRRRFRSSLSHLVSTAVAQFVDVSIFAIIAYYIGSNWYSNPEGDRMLVDIITSQYAVQFALSMLVTPIFAVVAAKCKEDNIAKRIF